MKILFIVNPVSGRGAGERAIPFIQNFIDKNHLKGSIIVTQYPAHAIEIASQKAKDFDILVATGGDGLEQTKTLQVTAIMGSLPVHADGETICTEGKSVSIQNHPNALQVVVPR